MTKFIKRWSYHSVTIRSNYLHIFCFVIINEIKLSIKIQKFQLFFKHKLIREKFFKIIIFQVLACVFVFLILKDYKMIKIYDFYNLFI